MNERNLTSHSTRLSGRHFASIAAAFLVSLLICCIYPARIYAQADEVSRSWNQPVKPYRVVGNIYYVGASDVTSFLIVTPRGHILLDSGFFETVPQIKQNIVQLGFRLEDVKFLINSHAHYDHAGGLALLKELTMAKLVATQADAELLARGGKDDFGFGDRFAYAPVTADRILNDGDRVELGDVTMTAHLTPGHTKGCTTWTMKVKEGSRQYDVVFVGSASVPGYKLVDNPQYPTIAADYERTFHVLKNLPCDVFLAPHGFFYAMQEKAKLLAQGKQQNPFIDQRGYRRYIAQSEKDFRKELKRQELARAGGPAGNASVVRPSLAGRWVLQFSSGGQAANHIALDISQTEPEVRVTEKLASSASTRELTYYTDSRGETNPAIDGKKTLKSTTEWNGNKLITKFSLLPRTLNNVPVLEERVDEWSVSRDGQTLTWTSSLTTSSPRQDASANPYGRPQTPNVLAAPLSFRQKRSFKRVH